MYTLTRTEAPKCPRVVTASPIIMWRLKNLKERFGQKQRQRSSKSDSSYFPPKEKKLLSGGKACIFMNVIRLTIIEWRPRLLLFNGSMNGYEKEAKKQFSSIGKSQATTTGVFSLLLLYQRCFNPNVSFLLVDWVCAWKRSSDVQKTILLWGRDIYTKINVNILENWPLRCSRK